MSRLDNFTTGLKLEIFNCCKDMGEESKTAIASKPLPPTSSLQGGHPQPTMARKQHFRLFDLPLEIQRLIFDCHYEPWSLTIIDTYWRLQESDYFDMDRYASDTEYSPVLLQGVPPPFLSMTCKAIYNETQSSLMRSFLGQTTLFIKHCHLRLPELPDRLSFVYPETTYLILYERAFIDLFTLRDFPTLEDLIVKCCPDTLEWDGEEHLEDEDFQAWARQEQIALERRSRKPLLHSKVTTILDPGFEQIDGGEYVQCYLAEEQEDIGVDREKCDEETEADNEEDDVESLDDQT
ncbi:hypothetical protein PMZ80_005572 [Knufia obscura]|uniref:F-box domain-containing protein n=1 Tax=Knufia obscura TaxID=1635080 RepID=A0ABR0RLY5_9EURO|nr:hypothetical protein PMZ80_005572 [Knufia obscura]